MKCVVPICVALLLASCAATKDLADFEAVSSEKALVRWHRKGLSLVYEAVCARSAGGAVLVRLYKQSPAPLVVFRLEPEEYFVAKGRLAGRGWVGPAPDAPAKLAPWIAFLTAYRQLAGTASDRQLQTAGMRVTYTKSGNKLKVLSVKNLNTGEVVSAVFD